VLRNVLSRPEIHRIINMDCLVQERKQTDQGCQHQ